MIGLLELPLLSFFHFWISIIFDFRYKEDLDEDTGNWQPSKLEGPSHGAMDELSELVNWDVLPFLASLT